MTAPLPRRRPSNGTTAPESVRRGEQLSRLAALLETRYGANGVTLTPFYEGADKAVYRADRASADPWIHRFFPAARPLERVEDLASGALQAFDAECCREIFAPEPDLAATASRPVPPA